MTTPAASRAPTESPEEAERILEGEERDAAAAIDAVVAVLPEAWRPLVTRRVEAGDAGPMIVWVAEHEHSDVIVVGSHGHGVLKRLVMGSVSTHVMHHAPCPVLLVPPPPTFGVIALDTVAHAKTGVT